MLNPKITVVLGAYNQKDILEKVFNGYNHQSLDKDLFEVIVVDSSSPDGTGEMFKSFDAKFHLRGIVQENKGKAAARNRGVGEAHSPYIIITDADMIPHPDFVKSHLEAQLNSNSHSCFEGVTYNMTELHWPVEEDKLMPYITTNYPEGKRLGWFYFLTGNISFPKSTFEKYQGFDADFGGYGWEDLELGYRMSQDRIPLYYLKSAENYHYHVITEVEDIERHIKKGESAQIFLKKHPKLKWFLGLNPLSVLLRKRLSNDGFLVKWCRDKGYGESRSMKHRLSRWFLKEFNYLSGILSMDPIDLSPLKQR